MEHYRYTSPIRGRSPGAANQDVRSHGERLSRVLESALEEASSIAAAPASFSGERGFYLDVLTSYDGVRVIDKLEDRRMGVEIAAVTPLEGEGGVRASVFFPEQHAHLLLAKVRQYRDELTPSGNPRHAELVSRIEDATATHARSLFTDLDDRFPEDDEPRWWELWIRKGRQRSLDEIADTLEIRFLGQVLHFPERDVVLARARPSALESALHRSDAIAELRLAKAIPEMLAEAEQRTTAELARNLADRLRVSDDLSCVTVLDSGITARHPLLHPLLDPATDCYTVNDAWGVDDPAYGQWHGHGTMMGGIAGLGDIAAAARLPGLISINHGLESVKILPPRQQNDPQLWGALTLQGIALPEVYRPNRRRVFALATTGEDKAVRGRPSSWSAAIDQAAHNNGENSRVLVLAAGNIRGLLHPEDYPHRNDVESIESPAQSWNAVTVSGMTTMTATADPDYADLDPVAGTGQLSPASRTSLRWERDWPIKPDVVAEAGNLLKDGEDCIDPTDMKPLTCGHRPAQSLFVPFGGSSAATAEVARIASELYSRLPTAQPETIRGLVIHSAEWSPAMRGRLTATSAETERRALVRRYGYGVPDLGRASLSARNDVTLIVEGQIYPFLMEDGRIKTAEMQLHHFPWPRDFLVDLGETPVRLKATLSYFIEPNPGERGWTTRHQYASHGLRFHMKRALETEEVFLARINRELRDEGSEGQVAQVQDSDKWLLRRLRNAGSVHSDIWEGTAIAMSQRDAIAVFPVTGWWKEKPALGHYDRPVNYALIVSLAIPGQDIELYERVRALVQVDVSQPIAV